MSKKNILLLLFVCIITSVYAEKVAVIKISPNQITLEPGQSFQFKVEAYDSNYNLITPYTYLDGGRWKVEDIWQKPGKGSITSNGLYIAPLLTNYVHAEFLEFVSVEDSKTHVKGSARVLIKNKNATRQLNNYSNNNYSNNYTNNYSNNNYSNNYSQSTQTSKTPKIETPKTETPKVETPKTETPKTEEDSEEEEEKLLDDDDEDSNILDEEELLDDEDNNSDDDSNDDEDNNSDDDSNIETDESVEEESNNEEISNIDEDELTDEDIDEIFNNEDNNNSEVDNNSEVSENNNNDDSNKVKVDDEKVEENKESNKIDHKIDENIVLPKKLTKEEEQKELRKSNNLFAKKQNKMFSMGCIQVMLDAAENTLSKRETEQKTAVAVLEAYRKQYKEAKENLPKLSWFKRPTAKTKLFFLNRKINKLDFSIQDMNVHLSIKYCALAAYNIRKMSEQEKNNAIIHLFSMYEYQKKLNKTFKKISLADKEYIELVNKEYNALINIVKKNTEELEKIQKKLSNKPKRMLREYRIKKANKKIAILLDKVEVDTAISYLLNKVIMN